MKPDEAHPAKHTGASALAGGTRGTHEVQFYDADSGLIDGVSNYVGEVLEEGNVALIVAIEPHRDLLTERLRQRGLNMDAAIAEGRYVLLDADETLHQFLTEGWPDPERYKEMMARNLALMKTAARGNPPRLAIFGEMVALLWAQGRFEAAVRLEQLWTELQQTEPFTLRCAYPMGGFDRKEHAKAFMTICSEHAHVIPAESYTSLTTEDERLREVGRLQQGAMALQHSEQESSALAPDNARGAQEGALSGDLLRAGDAERRRIARELHDGAGQDLALLGMNLSSLEDQARLTNPGVAAIIRDNAEIVRRMSEELRALTYLLHPPLLEEAGLEPALRWYAEGFERRSGIRLALELSPTLGRLPAALEMSIFRVIEASLTNVERHSNAKTAGISVRRSSSELRLDIRDDGKGLPANQLKGSEISESAGLGLRGIQRRVRDWGGTLRVFSDEGGTRIQATIPIQS